MSNVELGEWLTYQAVEPGGEEQADRRAALICAVIEAAHIDPKKRHLAKGVDGFLRILQPHRPAAERPEQSPGDLRAGMIALSARSKGKRTRRPAVKGRSEPET